MLLKGLILIPNQEVKLDINNKISKKIIMISSKNYNDELKGEIILNGDIAEVSFFGDEWLDFAGFNYQEFEKISEVPYDLY